MTGLLVRTRRQTAAGAWLEAWFADRPMAPAPAGTILDGVDLSHVVVEDRLLGGPPLRRELSADLAQLAGTLGVGQLELANGDGALDSASGDIWRSVAVFTLAAAASPWAPGAAILLYRADCGRADRVPAGARPARLSVALVDAMARLDRPLQASRYAGTNNGTSILHEGEPGGLKGRPKPVLAGDLATADGPALLPAPQVNGARLTFQLHDGALSDRPEVLDRGVAAGLADDGDWSGAAFDARVLPAASFCTDAARGLVKITSGLVGPVSFAAATRQARPGLDWSGPAWACAQILARANLAPGARGVISAGTLAALEPAGSVTPVGWWFDTETSVREALAPFARAGGGVLVATRTGELDAVALAAPKPVPDVTLAEEDLAALEPGAAAPAPVGAVRIGWGRIWAPVSGQDLAPSARGTALEARLGEAWRWAVAEDAPTQARAPDWRTVEIETALRTEAAALALAQRLLQALSLRPDGQARRSWQARLPLAAPWRDAPLGATVRLWAQGEDRLTLLTGETLCPGGPGGAGILEWRLFG